MASTTEDRDEILQLLYRYNHAMDSGDAHGWADLFTEDAVFDAAGQVVSGREALVEFASSVGGSRHVLANPVIDVAGDTATARAYLFLFRGTTVSIVGSYEDEVVRTPAGWRFAKRVFTRDAAADQA
jgi:ketosteroid isomerase-like protein